MSSLSAEPPADPLPLVAAWLEAANDGRRNPHAMALATSDAGARPSVRMVLKRNPNYELRDTEFKLASTGFRFRGYAADRRRQAERRRSARRHERRSP